jgi:hypothetical protein
MAVGGNSCTACNDGSMQRVERRGHLHQGRQTPARDDDGGLVMLKPPVIGKLCDGQANYVRFRLSPDVTIAISVRVKRPGEDFIGDPAELQVVNYPRESNDWLILRCVWS